MNNWITIIRVDLPIDAQLIRSTLEMEGIEVSIPDEYTTDIAPFYAQAIGGIRVQVKKENCELSHTILYEKGFIKTDQKTENKILQWIDKKASMFPIIKGWKSEVRILIFSITVLALIITPIVYMNQPSMKEQLSSGIWCLTKVTHKGKNLRAVNSDKQITYYSGNYMVSFNKSGRFSIPQFEDAAPIVSWGEFGKGIYVHVDSTRNNAGLATFLEGEYEVFQKGDVLELKKHDVFIQLKHVNMSRF